MKLAFKISMEKVSKNMFSKFLRNPFRIFFWKEMIGKGLLSYEGIEPCNSFFEWGH